ncbi:TatD family hydrolase [Natranaerobius trueperi]|uniref:Hydrolase TatD n=1 Tax=Natranaerobius trueperi TaxID=759412 RepID=A0A226BXC4_9FIRM|nr:TatD family hydrolase [Natranaerobius trueperi]OWZ83646.1 hydrolase TatD [Natranaerobius trueperi]
MVLIDTHAHLDSKKLAPDLDRVVSRAKQKGVSRIINVGITLESSQKSIEFAKRYPEIFASVGIHPHDTEELPDNYIEEIKKLVQDNREYVVALGEMGLDYYRNYSPKKNQKETFIKQLELANELQLPVIIHDRAAHEDTLEILEEFKNEVFGVFHCFAGDEKIADKALDLGYFISFTGNITFKKAEELRKVVKQVPLSRLMVETDCPYLSPEPFRGKINEPAYVRLVAEAIAEIKNVDFQEVVSITGENASNLFKI